MFSHNQTDRRNDMDTLGIYVFNETRNQWLQEDKKTWGSFAGAQEFTPGDERLAEDIRLRETKGGDVTYTMAALH